jgi:uncharacterized cupin superfamily protein
MIALRALDLPARCDSGYPEPFRSRVLPREKRALGDAFGLNSFGVNLTTLAPGSESSMRHWHSHEDELIYVLEGELVLVTDAGEEPLTPGMVVGFSAGVENGHQLLNRSDRPAVYLEIGGRDQRDVARYPDVDLHCEADADGRYRFSRKDGTPYMDPDT